MGFSVEISSIPSLKIDQTLYNKNLEHITEKVAEKLQESAPRSKNAGPHFADMFVVQKKPQTSGYETTLSITNTKTVEGGGKQYNLFELITMGTSPHAIFGNPVLRFNIGSQTIFTHSVQHPGTRPNLFMERIIKENVDIELEEWSELVYENYKEE